jgi:hypothetical protein
MIKNYRDIVIVMLITGGVLILLAVSSLLETTG